MERDGRVRVGDELVAVDGMAVGQREMEEVSALIVGLEGTQVCERRRRGWEEKGGGRRRGGRRWCERQRMRCVSDCVHVQRKS